MCFLHLIKTSRTSDKADQRTYVPLGDYFGIRFHRRPSIDQCLPAAHVNIMAI